MTESDPLRRYVEAGIALTQLTRSKAERIVRDLVKAGELQREQAQDRVEELLDRSRKSSEGLLGLIRKEISQQLSSLGLATKQDLDDLERRVEGRMATAAPTPPRSTTTAAKAAKAAAARPGKAPPGPTATAAAKKPARNTKAAQETTVTTPPPGSAARTAGAPKVSRRPSGSGPDSPADAT